MCARSAGCAGAAPAALRADGPGRRRSGAVPSPLARAFVAGMRCRRRGVAAAGVLIVEHPARGAAAGCAVQMLRHGDVDVALVFRHADAPLEDDGFRMVHVADDSIHLVSRRAGDSVANHRRSAWIGGCEGCQGELTAVCREYGFAPRIESVCDDMVVVQALVAAGIGVTTLPGLALRAHRLPDVHTTEIPDFPRRIYIATYGDPPDPPGTAALIHAIQEAAR